jgi:hypothetical protein
MHILVRRHSWRRVLVATGVAAALATTAACGGGGGNSGGHTPTSSKGTALVISPNHGAPDTRIVVTGCGFEENKTVKIETPVLDPRSITSDASGDFYSETIVPSVGPGTYTVRASTSDAVFAETVFTVESQAGDTGKSPTPQSSPETARC